MWRSAVILGLPVAGMLGGIGSVLLIDVLESNPAWVSQYWDKGTAVVLQGYAVLYIPLWIASLLIGIGLVYSMMRLHFTRSYQAARSILYHTEVPILIADEQFMDRIGDQAQAAGFRVPATSSATGGAESRLKLAAVYLQALYAHSQGRSDAQPHPSRTMGWLLNPNWSTAFRLLFVTCGAALCCPLNFGLSCLLGPPLAAFASSHSRRYAEYLGNLTAICEFMVEGMS